VTVNLILPTCSLISPTIHDLHTPQPWASRVPSQSRTYDY
jgi:hypothetical protein